MQHEAIPQTGVRFTQAHRAHLDEILALEQAAYPLPWSRQNFISILDDSSGRYTVQLLRLRAERDREVLAGYFVALLGVEEAHLLNVAVHPRLQGQGWGQLLLRQLQTWAVLHGARQIWLEVRDSNPRARQVYERWGYVEMGRRKDYYPALGGGREAATVMCLQLPD
ncbi:MULTISPECIES: ribosomal protein S18-alanine N-acetyltransferase [Brachymonas]|uniref:ribosomal protein S18-alanine N-acetyltransferase n=1 Tax=Brachymonas TaxID=28219 RepID=UPI002E768494|nr:ribosomal protein S18-alanine N-acetyltransferase [Brachymonas sp. J145]MEE1652631.1 ribosomal protein S18-alanine N-acetyltransferase [Brachymonas sp. J145]